MRTIAGSNLYNPEEDYDIRFGKEEDFGFHMDDLVMYTNPAGIIFGPFKITGFVLDGQTHNPEHTIYINTQSPWFPVKPSSLELVAKSDWGTV